MLATLRSSNVLVTLRILKVVWYIILCENRKWTHRSINVESAFLCNAFERTSGIESGQLECITASSRTSTRYKPFDALGRISSIVISDVYGSSRFLQSEHEQRLRRMGLIYGFWKDNLFLLSRSTICFDTKFSATWYYSRDCSTSQLYSSARLIQYSKK